MLMIVIASEDAATVALVCSIQSALGESSCCPEVFGFSGSWSGSVALALSSFFGARAEW